MKRLLGLSLVLAMVIILVAGCFGGGGGTQSGFDDDGNLVLTFFYANARGGPFRDEWPVFQRAAELTGVVLRGVVPRTNTDEGQALSLMLASQDFADIITTSREYFDRYAAYGVFIPLNDLLEEHAPNIMRYFEENPWAREAATSVNGNIYHIPRIMDPVGVTAKGWFIRQDWLDVLDLPVPSTVEELEYTLRAFRERDPNGSGVQDEVPFFDRHGILRDSVHFLHGVQPDWSEQNGVVSYGRAHANFRTAVYNAARWHAYGLIDQEIFTRGHNARDMLFGDNLGGMVHDWFTSTAQFNAQLQDAIPGFNLVPISPPADINGRVAEATSRNIVEAFGWGISSQNEFPVETIQFFDFWFTEEGHMLNNFGIEGEHYTMIDGHPTVKPEVLNSGIDMNTNIWSWGGGLMIGAQQDFRFEEQWMNPLASLGMRLYLDNDYVLPSFPQLSFTAEEQRIIADLWSTLEAFMDEQEQRWVLGREPVNDETWARYMADLQRMGIDEVTAVRQAAFDRLR